MRSRRISRDEQKLWRLAMKDVRKGQQKVRQAEQDFQEYVDELGLAKQQHIESKKNKIPTIPKQQSQQPIKIARTAPTNIHDHETWHRTFSGIDRALVRRLLAGKLPIEASIDLHGMIQSQAHQQLENFLARCLRQDMRLVLVITGKGRHGDGIIRTKFPQWIKMSSFAQQILTATPASPKHGGSGAFYVYLRRRRDAV